jgi:argininosuccinate lyase
VQNTPFRDAYKEVAEKQYELESRKAIDSINHRVSPGGCANLMLDELRQRLEAID